MQQAESGRAHAAGAAEREREAIDAGRERDKIPGFDPAAAPMGADAESAGAPPVAEAAPETGRSPAPPADPGRAADPSGADRDAYSRQDRLVLPVMAILLVVVIAAIVAAGLLGV